MNYRVLHMLEQAGFKFTPDVMHKLPLFEKLVKLEREECAKTAEAVVPRHTECGNKIAGAIRARGNHD
jgi:hypothetical protein